MSRLFNVLLFLFEWIVTRIFDNILEKLKRWHLRDRELKALEARLETKYTGTTFAVAPDSTHTELPIFDLAADVLLEEIDGFLRKYEDRDIVVGIVGGATIRHIVQSLWSRKRKLNKSNWRRLLFIPLNKAGDPRYYQFSANYLAVSLSEVFQASSHLVPLPNWNREQQKKYSACVDGCDLLICSAGGRDGFLCEWLKKRRAPVELPSEAVGDFCLLPINTNGDVIRGDNKLQRAVTQLSPNPRFEKLSELKRKYGQLIFPITAHPRYFTLGPRSNVGATEKKEIAKVVLSSGVINHCILNKTLAENIL